MPTYPDNWEELRELVFQRDNRTCVNCGEPAEQVDHIVPLSSGGTNKPSNLVSLCVQCHVSKEPHLANLVGLQYLSGDPEAVKEKIKRRIELEEFELTQRFEMIKRLAGKGIYVSIPPFIEREDWKKIVSISLLPKSKDAPSSDPIG